MQHVLYNLLVCVWLFFYFYVHIFFRLILIAEKDTVYDHFPTPLINRMEKHFVLTSSILKGWQKSVLKLFEEWINRFSSSEYDNIIVSLW